MHEQAIMVYYHCIIHGIGPGCFGLRRRDPGDVRAGDSRPTDAGDSHPTDAGTRNCRTCHGRTFAHQN